ncbi:MAG: nuclear transport factor 2 family protein [Congregibacter sp.]|nr:nuclear transport factor 2 family protein [Congregibacter sp.]
MSQPDLNTRLAIQEALARSAYALDERHMVELEAGFAESAQLEIVIAGADPIVFESRDTIMGLMRDAAETQTDVRRHITTNLFFDAVEPGGTVSCTSNLTITSVENGQIRLVTSGYYKDRFILENDSWLILHRRIELDMAY